MKEQIKRLLDVARGELGYHETGNNITKYGTWYGVQGAWCAMFVSWCADQAKLGSIIGKGAAVYQIANYIKSHGGKELTLADKPQPGDITTNMWPGNDDGLPDHIGIVESFDDATYTITVIEGNASDQVKRVTYTYQDRLDDTIYRIYRPAYTGADVKPVSSATSTPVKKGSDLVRAFQEAAIKDGLPLNVYGADGLWGPETAAAAGNTLQIGSTGNRVKLAQQLLLGWSGITLPKYGVDGHFGVETQGAVKKLQSRAGIAVDGVIGLDTWKVLLGVNG